MLQLNRNLSNRKWLKVAIFNTSDRMSKSLQLVSEDLSHQSGISDKKAESTHLELRWQVRAGGLLGHEVGPFTSRQRILDRETDLRALQEGVQS